MEPRYRFRIYLLTAIILAGFGALLSRLHEFQIVKKDEFLKKVPGDSRVTIREPGVRGPITDRNGIVLAKNVPNYEITLNLEETKTAYARQYGNKLPQVTYLKNERGMRREGSDPDIVAIFKEVVIKPMQELKLARNFNARKMATHYKTYHGFVPYLYRSDLSADEFAKAAEHNLELPGVYVGINSQRQYPYGSLASHIIGYDKPWSNGEIPEGADRKFTHYIGDEKGVEGIEKTMDDLLRGPEGRREVLKDEKGAIKGNLPSVAPGMGAKVELTIDARIQYLAENTLRHAGRAATVVMDVETGEILAMASVPDYDPNDFIGGLDPKKAADYNSNKAHPFINRCISRYTPGSTFKLGTAISAALQGQANRTYSCDPGYVEYGNAKVGCWIYNQHHGTHGSETLPMAIRNSCNPFFNKMANGIGPKAMTDGFTMLGFGAPTGIPLPGEYGGTIVGSRAWRAAHPGAAVTQHDVALFSIGQSVLATPLQLCAMVCAIANGGTYYQPRLVKKAISQDGAILIEDKPKVKVDLLKEGVKASDLTLIRQGMWMAVNQGGTAAAVKLPDVQVAAKTGTAQVNILLKTHDCWTVSFFPFEKPKYAAVILVQDGGSGGHVAGPLVQHLVRGIVNRDRGIRLPLQPQKPYAGHMKMIESIAALDDSPPADPNDTAGEETGDENQDPNAVLPLVPEPEVSPPLPTPTIKAEVDKEGTVIPRAVPVPIH